MSFLTNIYLWMFATFGLLVVVIMLFVFLLIIKMKTHAMMELKAWMKKTPLSFFFEDGKFFQMKAIQPSAIIEDKEYGCFVPTDNSAYVDKTTRQVIYVFDSKFAYGINVHGAKAIDDLKKVAKDESVLDKLRDNIMEGKLIDNPIIDTIKTSVNLNNAKYMMFSLLPHSIKSEIEKKVAARSGSGNKINGMQAVVVFCAILGAIVIGYILIKTQTK